VGTARQFRRVYSGNHASAPVDNHFECHEQRSLEFHRWLIRLHHVAVHRPASDAAINTAIETIEAEADVGGVSEQVFVRIAIFVRVTPCRLGKSGAENEEPLQLGQGCPEDADEATRRADMRVPASASLRCKRLSPLHERPP
jgi:hypothetical protein